MKGLWHLSPCAGAADLTGEHCLPRPGNSVPSRRLPKAHGAGGCRSAETLICSAGGLHDLDPLTAPDGGCQRALIESSSRCWLDGNPCDSPREQSPGPYVYASLPLGR